MRAPKIKKQSNKQITAEHKAGEHWAAAGRAAQRKAAANPKTAAAEHAKRSAASRKAAVTSARNSALRKAGKKVPAPAQKRAAVIADAGFLIEDRLPGSLWLMGCNDVAPTCAAAAVANHLLADTGMAMTDEEVLRLHAMAGGDDGADISAVLEVMRSPHHILFSKIRLARFSPTDEDCIVAGLVVGLRLGHAGHAVVSTPRGMISWGREMPWNGEPEEAWALEWLR